MFLNIIYRKAEAEVVPSSSLVKVEVEVEVEVGVEVEDEVGDEVGVEVGVEVDVGVILLFQVGGWGGVVG